MHRPWLRPVFLFVGGIAICIVLSAVSSFSSCSHERVTLTQGTNNFMRPVTGGDIQLFRELARAEAMDYGMVKTYVRLAHAEQAKIVVFAHGEMGYTPRRITCSREWHSEWTE